MKRGKVGLLFIVVILCSLLLIPNSFALFGAGNDCDEDSDCQSDGSCDYCDIGNFFNTCEFALCGSSSAPSTSGTSSSGSASSSNSGGSASYSSQNTTTPGIVGASVQSSNADYASSVLSCAPLITSGELMEDFFIFNETEIYGIGLDRNIWKWDGRSWGSSSFTSGLPVSQRIHVTKDANNIISIYAIAPVSQNSLYGAIWKWNSNTRSWAILTLGSIKSDFNFFAENDIYAIGEDNAVYHWDGARWNFIAGWGTNVAYLAGNGSFNELNQIGLNVTDKIHIIKEPFSVYAIGKPLTNVIILAPRLYKFDGQKWKQVVYPSELTPITGELPVKDTFYYNSEDEIFRLSSEIISDFDGKIFRRYRTRAIPSDVSGTYDLVNKQITKNGRLKESLKVLFNPLRIYSLGNDKKIWKCDIRPVAYYPLEGFIDGTATGIQDISGNNLNIRAGDTSINFILGISTNSAVLNGQNYFTLPRSSRVGYWNKFTLAGWFNISNNSPYNTVLLSEMNSGISWKYLLEITGSRVVFSHQGNRMPFQSGDIIEPNQWIHLALVVDNDEPMQKIRLYKNGDLVANSRDVYLSGPPRLTSSGQEIDNYLFLVGATQNNNAITPSFSGMMDNLQVYSHALSRDQILRSDLALCDINSDCNPRDILPPTFSCTINSDCTSGNICSNGECIPGSSDTPGDDTPIDLCAGKTCAVRCESTTGNCVDTPPVNGATPCSTQINCGNGFYCGNDNVCHTCLAGDTDGDGVADCQDACPLDSTKKIESDKPCSNVPSTLFCEDDLSGVVCRQNENCITEIAEYDPRAIDSAKCCVPKDPETYDSETDTLCE